jgi:hypothetical protein
MVDNIERRPGRPEVPSPPDGVVERPTEIPREVERFTGVRRTPSDVTAQVTDDSGRPLIQTPATKTVVIQIPTDPAKLGDLSKGEPGNAITWLATFFLRMLKKAQHFGWKIVGGGKSG